MEDKLLIQPAKLSDLPTLRQFEQGVIAAEKPFDPTLKDEHFTYYHLQELITSPDAELLVAIDQGEIVGSGYVRKDLAKTFQRFTHYAYIGFMYVQPTHRGRGISSSILNALFDWAKSRGLTEVRLDVYNDNMPAVRAYEKAGFTKSLVTMRLEI